MTRRFDLIVIGTGTAASAVAGRCRKAGWSVAVIDELPFGGTCSLRGCDPKKVLVGGAEAIEWTRRLRGKGVREDGLRIEWPELIRFKRSMIAEVPERKEEGFLRAGIEVFHGHARFTGPTTIEVAGQPLEARHVVIASGAKPAPLGIAGEELLTTSTQFLEGNRVRADYSVVPSVAFTVPPLAAVGLTEVAARQRGLRFRANLIDTSSWYSSRRVGETHSGSKVLIEEESGRILGAHLLGPSAEELINLFAMAMRTGTTSSQIKEMLFAYPSHGSDMAHMV